MAKRKPRKRPEPTKTIRDRVAKKLASGTFRTTVRKVMGISPGVWRDWIRDGNAEREEVDAGRMDELGLRGLFVMEIERAEAIAHERILRAGVMDAGPDAQRWFLVRRYPELYSTTPARGITDDETGELVLVDAREVLRDRLAALLDGMDT